MNTVERMQDYLKVQIRNKEAEMIRLNAELSTLRSIYSAFQTIDADVKRHTQEVSK